MRFLVHSGNATYNAVDKKFHFNLDRRFPNPTRVRISKVNYVASTSAAYPTVVYLRSSAIDDLVKTKHSVELTDEAHENPSDALAVLEETHTVSRYRQNGNMTFPVHGHKSNTDIDFYFTDNTSKLNGVYVVPSQPAVTDAQVLALPNMLMMLDWDFTGNVFPANIQTGTDISSIHSRVFSNLGYSLIFQTSAAGIEYATFGQTHALASTVAWHYAIENSTGNNPPEGQVGTLSMMFRTKDALSGWHWIFNSPLFKITAGSHIGGSNFMGYYDSDTNNYEVTSLQIAAATDYFIQIRKVGTTFEWLLRDLGNGAEQTETTVSNTATNGQPNQSWGISNAQTGINGMKISHIVEISSLDVDDLLTVKNWMLQKYTGQNIPGVPDPNARDASFFLQLDIDTK